MAESGDEIAVSASGYGRLRASHADREQAIEVLKAAFVQGWLNRDEFDLRVGQALVSQTWADDRGHHRVRQNPRFCTG